MHDVHGSRRLRRDDLPRLVDADGVVHGLLFRLYEQGHETLCQLTFDGAETSPSSRSITCVACLALHDEDLAHIEAMRLYNDHQGVCKLVAEMHAAAVGYVGGPNRGVVEDVADLKAEHDRLQSVCNEQKASIRRLEQRVHELELEKQYLYMKAMAP